MTWTLFGMSFCYIVFVGPIFFVSVLGIADETNLACFILYLSELIPCEMYFKLPEANV